MIRPAPGRGALATAVGAERGTGQGPMNREGRGRPHRHGRGPAGDQQARGVCGSEGVMPEKRVTVWVQRFNDRAHLVLQWTDPDTGRRKSKSAGTADEGEAERKRADLEYELNHGRYVEASRMNWER